MTSYLQSDIRKAAIMHIVLQVVSFVLSLVLLRLISPEIFGLIAMIIPIVLMQKVLHSFGTSNSIISKKSTTDEELSSLFWGKLIMSIGINLVFIISSPLIVAFYGEPQLYELILYFALSSVLYAISEVFLGILYRKNHYVKIAKAELFALLFAGSFAILLVYKDYALKALIAKEVLTVGVALTMYIFFSRWQPKIRLKISEVFYHFKFGINVSLSAFVSWLSRSLDDILIGSKYNSNDLGIYNKAYGLLTIPTSIITGLILRFGIPISAQAATEKDAENTYLSLAKISFAINAPIGIGLFFISDSLIPIILGSSWAPMIPFLKLFGILSIFQVLGPLDNLIYQGRNKTRQLVKSSVIVNIIIVVFILLGFLLTDSTYGIALYYTIGSLLAFIPSQYLLAKSMSIKSFLLLNNLIHILISISITFVVCLVMQKLVSTFSNLNQCFTYVICIPVIYLIALFSTNRESFIGMYKRLNEFIRM